MEKQRKLEVIVGVTVLIAILLVVGVLLWAKGAFFTGDVSTVDIKFDQVGGLTKSDIVSISGVTVGRVSAIEIQQDSVLVSVRITKDVQLKQDASAEIVSAELMGGKKIEFSPGSVAEPLAEGKVIKGTYTPGITELTSMFEDNRGDISQLLSDIKATVQGLKEIIGTEPEQENSLRAALVNMTSTTNQVDSLLRQNSRAINSTVNNLEQSSAILRQFLASEEQNASELLASSKKLASDIQMLSDSAQVFMRRLNNPNSSLSRLMTEDSLYNNLNRTVIAIDSLVSKLEKNPEEYLENVEFKVRLF